jgi:hypothetical protein
MRTIVSRTCFVALIAAAFGTQVSVSAQAPATGPEAFVSSAVGGTARGRIGLLAAAEQAAQQANSAQKPAPAPDGRPVRRLTADEAVQLAIENNLGIQISRLDPQIEDLNVAAARAAWAPAFNSLFQNNSIQRPSANIFTGSQEANFKQSTFTSNLGITQNLPWGGIYDLGWDSSRSSSNNTGNTWKPQLNSTLAFNYQQSLLRGWSIDNTRQQLWVSEKNREIADVGLRQTLVSTTRTVRNAYWNLAYAVASLAVQQQSLALAEESLRNTRSRVEIGHHSSNRHHRSGIRSGRAPGSGHRRGGPNRHSRRHAARAGIRSGDAGLLESPHRANRTSTVSTDQCRRGRCRAKRTRAEDGPCSRHGVRWRPPRSTFGSSATRHCPTYKPI